MREMRQQPRFLCVGIDLLYSPIKNSIIPDVANSLLQANLHDMSLAGMAFDVEVEMQVGDELLVAVKSPDTANEMLRTRIIWCNKLENNKYRVGVAISEIIQQVEITESNYDIEQLENTDGIPSQVNFICPACKARSWFELIGKQDGSPYPTVMPLYNCGSCHTTRTISSLLSFNREQATGD